MSSLASAPPKLFPYSTGTTDPFAGIGSQSGAMAHRTQQEQAHLLQYTHPVQDVAAASFIGQQGHSFAPGWSLGAPARAHPSSPPVPMTSNPYTYEQEPAGRAGPYPTGYAHGPPAGPSIPDERPNRQPLLPGQPGQEIDISPMPPVPPEHDHNGAAAHGGRLVDAQRSVLGGPSGRGAGHHAHPHLGSDNVQPGGSENAVTMPQHQHRDGSWSCRVDGCDLYGRHFRNKSDLNKHQRKHEPRPYRCRLCHFGARFEGHLRKHVQAVHDRHLRAFCRYCSRDYGRYDNLVRHMRDKHPQSAVPSEAASMRQVARSQVATALPVPPLTTSEVSNWTSGTGPGASAVFRQPYGSSSMLPQTPTRTSGGRVTHVADPYIPATAGYGNGSTYNRPRTFEQWQGFSSQASGQRRVPAPSAPFGLETPPMSRGPSNNSSISRTRSYGGGRQVAAYFENVLPHSAFRSPEMPMQSVSQAPPSPPPSNGSSRRASRLALGHAFVELPIRPAPGFRDS
jgi:hypothetical protein